MWFLPLAVCLAGFLVILTLSLFARLFRGVGWAELWRTRFFEVVPLRGLLWALLVLVGAALLVDVVVLGVKGWALVTESERPLGLILTVVGSAVLAVPLTLLGRGLLKFVAHSRVAAPAVTVTSANVQQGIPDDDFARLGGERFPNHVAPGRHADRVVRWAVVVAGGAVLGAVLFGLWTDFQGGRLLPTETLLPAAGDAAEPYLYVLGLFLVWVPLPLLGLLVYDNRDYTFLPFRRALALKLSLVGLVVAGLLLVRAPEFLLLLGAGVVTAALVARAALDLRRARTYDVVKTVYNPIADSLRQHVPYLADLVTHPPFRLPPLSADALEKRIARGCKNVESRGLLVTRHFGRFLDLVDVGHHDCAMVVLRYLTWTRFVTHGPASPEPASSPLCEPRVDWDDLTEFPLRPPNGYCDWLDSVTLGSHYDIVCWCGTCGGTGVVTRTITEYHTEYYTDSQGQSQTRQVATTRTVTETCPTCCGMTKLRIPQILNTRWECLCPLITHPEVRVPELLQDAEEATWVTVALNEGGHALRPQAQIAGQHGLMANRIVDSVRKIVAEHPKHLRMVEELHNGRLYRADLRFCGFRAICIRFRRLPGRVGWFFGKAPGFYFPRLPLAWDALGTGVFLPPLVLAGLLALVTFGWGVVSGESPTEGWTGTTASSGPFGLGVTLDPGGPDVEAFAAGVRLPGDAENANAADWVETPTPGRADSLDGEWFTRWDHGPGTAWSKVDRARVETSGDEIRILLGSAKSGYLIVARRDKDGRYAGRYRELGGSGESGLWVGRVVSGTRIDGVWTTGGGRWDFRRRLTAG